MPSRGPTKVLILVLFLLGYWAVGLYPFTFEPPKHVLNQAERTADGGLSFPGVGIARTPGAPDWLSALQDTSLFEVRLVARTDDPDQRGPARLFTISDGVSDRNLTLGQEDDDLVIRVRRLGSDANGTPALQVVGVFRDADWHAIRVRLGPDRLTVYANADIYVNLFGFIPFGALLVLLFGRRISIVHIMLLGAALSLSIETLQILLPRHPSVTDLALNSIGAGVGAYLARLAMRGRRRRQNAKPLSIPEEPTRPG